MASFHRLGIVGFPLLTLITVSPPDVSFSLVAQYRVAAQVSWVDLAMLSHTSSLKEARLGLT